MTGTDDVSILLDWYAGVLSATEIASVEARLCLEPALADLAIRVARDEAIVREWAARRAGLPDLSAPVRRRWSRVAFAVGSLAAAILAAVVLVRPENPPRIEDTDTDTVASIEDWSGEAAIIGEDGESRILTSGAALRRGERLQTGVDGQITFRFGDSARMELAADSRIFLPEGISTTRDPRLTLETGELSADVSPSRSIIVQTPHAMLQAGRTRFSSSAIPETTWVATQSGMVTMTPMGGGTALELRSNQYGVAHTGEAARVAPLPLVGVLTQPRLSLAFPSGPVMGLAMSPATAQVAMIQFDGSIAVRSLPTRVTSVLPPLLKQVRRVRFSPDGRTLAVVGEDRRVWLQDTVDVDTRVGLPKQKTDIRALAFSPDGTRIAYSAGVVRNRPEYGLCDTRTGAELVALGEPNPSPVTALDWQPNQPRLAEGRADGRLVLREMLGYSVELVLLEVGAAIDIVRWSPDGQSLAVGFRNGRVGLYDLRSHSWVWQDDSHPKEIASLDFSPDGRLILSTGTDAVVRVRDVTTGDSLHLLRGSKARSTSAAFSPDGREIWVSGTDRQVRVWDRPPGH